MPSTDQFRRLLTYPIVVLGIAIFINGFLMLFVVPKFGQIFQEALPGQTLPVLTQCILTYHSVLTLVSSSLFLLGICIEGLARKNYFCEPITILLLAVQVGVIVIALFTPLIRLIIFR